jgi:hypothetical protein
LNNNILPEKYQGGRAKSFGAAIRGCQMTVPERRTGCGGAAPEGKKINKTTAGRTPDGARLTRRFAGRCVDTTGNA